MVRYWDGSRAARTDALRDMHLFVRQAVAHEVLDKLRRAKGKIESKPVPDIYAISYFSLASIERLRSRAKLLLDTYIESQLGDEDRAVTYGSVDPKKGPDPDCLEPHADGSVDPKCGTLDPNVDKSAENALSQLHSLLQIYAADPTDPILWVISQQCGKTPSDSCFGENLFALNEELLDAYNELNSAHDQFTRLTILVNACNENAGTRNCESVMAKQGWSKASFFPDPSQTAYRPKNPVGRLDRKIPRTAAQAHCAGAPLPLASQHAQGGRSLARTRADG